MKKIIEVLRLKHEANLSHEKIARACQLSKGVVSKYLSLAQAKGLGWPLPEDTDEAALEALLFPAKAKPDRFVEPDYFQVHQELKRKGVTLQLLWAEYVARHGEWAYRYSRFCGRYREWRARQKRSLRQQHRAGEKAFIDYCGPTVPIVDRHTGEIRDAQVFVGVLGASSYTYAEATHTQSLPDWIASHQRMLRFFGGVPELLVPDNLKAAVTRACRYAPKINATYTELAAHYGTAVLPARPYKPRDKAKAEVAVQVVERWILARLRHRTLTYRDVLMRREAGAGSRLLPGRAECRHRRAAARAQRAALPGTHREPQGPVRGPGPACAQAAAPGRLRVRRVAQGEARHRLPRRGGQALLQRSPCPGGAGPGAAHHRHHRRGDA